jgi:hypothetical protein
VSLVGGRANNDPFLKPGGDSKPDLFLEREVSKRRDLDVQKKRIIQE